MTDRKTSKGESSTAWRASVQRWRRSVVRHVGERIQSAVDPRELWQRVQPRFLHALQQSFRQEIRLGEEELAALLTHHPRVLDCSVQVVDQRLHVDATVEMATSFHARDKPVARSMSGANASAGGDAAGEDEVMATQDHGLSHGSLHGSSYGLSCAFAEPSVVFAPQGAKEIGFLMSTDPDLAWSDPLLREAGHVVATALADAIGHALWSRGMLKMLLLSEDGRHKWKGLWHMTFLDWTMVETAPWEMRVQVDLRNLPTLGVLQSSALGRSAVETIGLRSLAFASREVVLACALPGFEPMHQEGGGGGPTS